MKHFGNHAIVLLLALVALASNGCDSCDHCNDRTGSPFRGQIYDAVWVARIPANDPVNAAHVGQLLGRKCIGEFERSGADIYIFGRSDAEAECVKRLLLNAGGSIKITFGDKGPF